jgi:hypothetical protein
MPPSKTDAKQVPGHAGPANCNPLFYNMLYRMVALSWRCPSQHVAKFVKKTDKVRSSWGEKQRHYHHKGTL